MNTGVGTGFTVWAVYLAWGGGAETDAEGAAEYVLLAGIGISEKGVTVRGRRPVLARC